MSSVCNRRTTVITLTEVHLLSIHKLVSKYWVIILYLGVPPHVLYLFLFCSCFYPCFYPYIEQNKRFLLNLFLCIELVTCIEAYTSYIRWLMKLYQYIMYSIFILTFILTIIYIY